MTDAPAATTPPESEAGEASNSLLDVILAARDGLLVVDSRGVVLFANPAAAQALGRASSDLAGLPFGLPLMGGGRLAELDVVRPGNQLAVVEMHAAPIRWSGEEAQVVTLRDVTERVTAQRRIQVSQERYALSEAAVNDGLWDWDSRTGLLHTSARLREMLNLPAQEGDDEPDTWRARVHPDDEAGLDRAVAEHTAGRTPRLTHEVRLRRRDGSWLWVLVRGLAVHEGDKVVRFAGSVTDISERRYAEDALLRRALHDPLTGLANRALILDHMHGAIERQRRHGPSFAVVFLDLDHFKHVNDSLGHSAGDALLIEVSRRLERSVRATDTVGRLGGDEFVVLLEAPADLTTVLRAVRRIRQALAAPIRIGAAQISISASMGLVLGDDVAGEPDASLRNADIAMYEAKTHGRDGFRVFTSSMREASAARLDLRTRLRRAVSDGSLGVRYQQVVDLTDGRIRGFEALLRWRLEGGEVLDAESFIDTAEDTGVLVDVGWDVLTGACRQAGIWRDAGFPVWISVNLADGQVSAPDLTDRVVAALLDAGVDGSALRLEITERVAMTRVHAAVSRLVECRALGVDVLIDDFGTGYSSLTALHELPLTALKIDKRFVASLGGDIDVIVRSILSLARELGLDVIAEGIETAEQAARLQALGCHVGQGYLYGHALDSEAATRLLHSQRRTGARP